LLDEPFGSLDDVTRFRLDEDVSRLVGARGVTVLLVTHSISEAVFLADEIVVLSNRPANIVERFDVNFENRDENLRVTPAFAEVSARVYETLRSGSENLS
jgi:NitT/TauT family transport system ATP-binding protein